VDRLLLTSQDVIGIECVTRIDLSVSTEMSVSDNTLKMRMSYGKMMVLLYVGIATNMENWSIVVFRDNEDEIID